MGMTKRNAKLYSQHSDLSITYLTTAQMEEDYYTIRIVDL